MNFGNQFPPPLIWMAEGERWAEWGETVSQGKQVASMQILQVDCCKQRGEFTCHDAAKSDIRSGPRSEEEMII